MVPEDTDNLTPVQIHFILMKPREQFIDVTQKGPSQEFLTEFDRRVAPRVMFYETIDLYWPEDNKLYDLTKRAIRQLSQQSGLAISLENCLLFNREIPKKTNFLAQIEEHAPSKWKQLQKLLESSLLRICQITSLQQPLVIQIMPKPEIAVNIKINYPNKNNEYEKMKVYSLRTFASDIIQEHLSDYLIENQFSLMAEWKVNVYYIDAFGKSRRIQVSDYLVAKKLLQSLEEKSMDLKQSIIMPADLLLFFFCRFRIEIHELLLNTEQTLQIIINFEKGYFFFHAPKLPVQITRQQMRLTDDSYYFDEPDNEANIEREKKMINNSKADIKEIKIVLNHPYQEKLIPQFKPDVSNTETLINRMDYHNFFSTIKDIVRGEQTLKTVLSERGIHFNPYNQVIIMRNKQLLTIQDLKGRIETTEGKQLKAEQFQLQYNYVISTSSTIKDLCVQVLPFVPLYLQICPKHVRVRLSLICDEGQFDEREVFEGNVRIIEYIDDLIDNHGQLIEMFIQYGIMSIKNISYTNLAGEVSILKGEKRSTIQRRKYWIEKYELQLGETSQSILEHSLLLYINVLKSCYLYDKYHYRIGDLLTDWSQTIHLTINLGKDNHINEFLSGYENVFECGRILFEAKQ